jgi:hypothetical protein
LPRFYLAVLDEADELWPAAIKDFQEFLTLDKDSTLSAKARRELEKLPLLIKEDSSPSGKLNREYRQHLGSADMLFKQGFAKEALLEASEAAKLLPRRWEAYAVASNLLLSQNDIAGAKHFFSLAQQNIPSDSASRLETLWAQIDKLSRTARPIPRETTLPSPGQKKPS